MREVQTGRVEVTDVVTPICVAGQGCSVIKIINVGDVPIYVGSETVAAQELSQGWPIAPGAKEDFMMDDADATGLFGITAEGESTEVVYLTN